MVSEDLIWTKQIVEEQDRQGVLAYIVVEKVVTIEMLVESFPWLRWGKLFSLLGVLLQEGLVTLQQRDFVFEVRIKE